MYAMSSVNEGKFRVLSDSMIAAFQGAPKSMQPINIGQKQVGKGGEKQLIGVTPTVLMKIKEQKNSLAAVFESDSAGATGGSERGEALDQMQHQVEEGMKALIDAKLLSVHRENLWLEIEINTDILFPIGAADFSPSAEPVLDKLAEVLKPFPNSVRVEGHTDDRPIRTVAFPSNWELSAARAASVVHQFMRLGIDPQRMEIVGFGEFHPKQSNDTPEGRNANRRVAVLILQSAAAGGAVPAPPAEKTVLVKSEQKAPLPPAEATHE
jgi:chemotaxis protein MotB